ncbi:MAG TPA: WYL domain-containing protein [Candidatus Atribacteria bacterium]|nr:WYL domain-containing protein [Candidatus Atribacteria bacterium]
MRGVIFTICGHPEEIKRWVIGYGAHAEILEPEYLRKEVEKEIEKLQEIYHSDRK